MYVRRAPFALALALALAPLARAAAAQPAPSGGGNQWAVLLGIEDGAGDTALQLRGDLEFAQRPLSSMVGLSVVGSLGYAHFSRGYTDFAGDSVSSSLDLLKIVPAARFSLFAAPSFRLYGDAGLGLYYGSASVKYRDALGNVYASGSDSSVGIMMRLAVGAQLRVTPAFSLGAELGFSPYFANVPDDTFTSLLFSAAFRM